MKSPYAILFPLLLAAAAVFFLSCAGGPSNIQTPAKLPRTYRIDSDSPKGLIYGKLVHYQGFGKNFVLVFKNNPSGNLLNIQVESYSSSDTATNLFMEFEPGEWFVHQIKSQSGETILLNSIRKTENKEFIVEKGGITYVGSWLITPAEFEVRNEQQLQDEYMRMNYKNVMTAEALLSLP